MTMEFNDRQMNAMLEDDTDFVEYLGQVIMPEHVPEFADFVNDHTFPRQTRNGRAYARHFGFEDPADQMHFVVLMWKLGPDFFTKPGLKEIIEQRDMTPEARIDAIYNDMPDEYAVDAIMSANHLYWFPEEIENNVLGVPYEPFDPWSDDWKD